MRAGPSLPKPILRCLPDSSTCADEGWPRDAMSGNTARAATLVHRREAGKRRPETSAQARRIARLETPGKAAGHSRETRAVVSAGASCFAAIAAGSGTCPNRARSTSRRTRKLR